MHFATNVTDGPSPKINLLVSPALVPTKVPGVSTQSSSSIGGATAIATVAAALADGDSEDNGAPGAPARPLGCSMLSEATKTASICNSFGTEVASVDVASGWAGSSPRVDESIAGIRSTEKPKTSESSGGAFSGGVSANRGATSVTETRIRSGRTHAPIFGLRGITPRAETARAAAAKTIERGRCRFCMAGTSTLRWVLLSNQDQRTDRTARDIASFSGKTSEYERDFPEIQQD